MKEQLIEFNLAKLAKEKGFGYDIVINAKTEAAYYGCSYQNTYLMDTIYYYEHYPKVQAQLVKDTYNSTGFRELYEAYSGNVNEAGVELYLVTTQSLVQQWLRDTHKLHIGLSLNAENPKNNYQVHWDYAIYSIKNTMWLKDEHETLYKTYEEALEQALIEALKLL